MAETIVPSGSSNERKVTSPCENSGTNSQRDLIARAVRNLYTRYCELPTTDDPRAFIAAAIGIAARYPIATVEAAFDPVDGLPSRKRRPALDDIKAALREVYEPVAMRLERERIEAEHRSYLPPPPATAEEKALVQKKLDELKCRLAAATATPADMPKDDYAARALADLAARRKEDDAVTSSAEKVQP